MNRKRIPHRAALAITTASAALSRHGPLLASAIVLLAAVPPVQAQLLKARADAGSSVYDYNTIQGVTAQSGNGSGSTGIGGPIAQAFASSSEGSGGFFGTQSATASADYATGGLRATAITEGFSQARASARLYDTVTFRNDSVNAPTVLNVLIDLTLNGTISVFQSAGYLYDFKLGGQFSGASVGWTTQFYDTPQDPRNYVGWAVSGGTGAPDGFTSWALLAGTATQKHFRGVLAVRVDQAYGLETGFSLGCNGGTDCDFGNSAHLNFELPPGASFTSASGLLLTAAVPEPGTWALMLAGLGVVGWMGRRRRA